MRKIDCNLQLATRCLEIHWILQYSMHQAVFSHLKKIKLEKRFMLCFVIILQID